ncbi:hypothetical protein ACFFLS_07150 [Flavobacterium procerum]|uniref:Uncharacterized protein n=1 Tax=Flavobacterium procerum TaxID=1455569 RepID=A0ABV6BMZ1_9FLAO
MELNECFSDPVEKDEYLNTVPRKCYLSALTIYMDNKGKIIKGEKVLTTFKLKYINYKPDPCYVFDSSFKTKKEVELCVDGKELHNHVIKNKKIKFRNGKEYNLNSFHTYIVQASICNRRLDVNYTHLKVTSNRDELNKKLNLLGIAVSLVGFVNLQAIKIADYSIKFLALAISIEPRFSLAEYTYPINGPVYLDNQTFFQAYEKKNYNGYVSEQRKDGPLITNPEEDLLRLIVKDYGVKIE